MQVLRHGWGSRDYSKPEISSKRVKVPIAVKEIVSALNTASRDHGIDRLPDSDAPSSKYAAIPRCLDRDLTPANLHHQQCRKKPLCCHELSLAAKPLKDLRKDQIADGKRLIAKESIEPVCLRRDVSLKVVNPNAGIDKDQRSVLISFRSPCHASLPRSLRISPCRLRRSNIRSPSSTTSRFVFSPLARSASRINLSSITMFVRMMCILTA